MIPTFEQSAIIEAATTTSDNLLIEALAGSAKTTTLEMIARALPNIPILCLAFNKKIAEEMTTRLPSHVQCRTFNAIGHRIWQATLQRPIKIDSKKMTRIIRAIPLLPGEKKEFFDTLDETYELVKAAKLQGWLPERPIDSFNLMDSLDFEPTHFQWRFLEKAITASDQEAFNGTLDFDDQIRMPTLFSTQFPKFPLVLVDEAQDLSPLNHVMLSKLVTARIIAVGDPLQSIYGFRGSVLDGMEQLRELFFMHKLPLTVSFRCPQETVLLARKHAPAMTWPSWAIKGLVRFPTPWSSSDIPDGAAIICRNNAPLFTLALRLLREGRSIQFPGRDIAIGLTRIMKKLGPADTPRASARNLLAEWEAAEIKRGRRSRAVIRDRAECLRVFINTAPTLGEAISYAEVLFAQTGSIILLSGHKAKGLEFTTVFHLDPWRIPSRYAITPEEIQQEENLRYVIITRTKETYNEVNLRDYEGEA